MRDLAPGIVRQRLLVEALYTVDVDAPFVDRFLHGLAEHLGLRTYADATIVAPGGQGRDTNEGFDAFLPLIDSGISLYIWTTSRFLACVLFTCKQFDAARAVAFVEDSFGTTDSTSLEF
jgi:S-adenosylmethionine decarboxylase